MQAWTRTHFEGSNSRILWKCCRLSYNWRTGDFMIHPLGNAHPVSSRTTAIIALTAGFLALALRLYFVTHAQVLQALDDPSVRSDASQYYHYAWNLVHHGVFSGAVPGTADVHPDSFRDPGYPTFLAMGLKLTNSFDAFYALILITQAILGAVTVALLAAAARSWLTLRPLAIASLLMAVWPHSVSSPAFVLTETLVGFLCAAALFATAIAARRNGPLYWALAGLAWSLAGMTNAVLLPVGTVLAATLWLGRRVDRRAAMALALTSIILPLAWGIRSSSLPTQSAADSSSGRAITNFIQGSWPTYHDAFQLTAQGNIDGIHHMQWMQYEIDTFTKSPSAGLALMRTRMSEKPMAHVLWYAWKPALLWAWDIRVGQGDIYVYPTRNSPFFTTGPLWPLEATCYILNPVLAALMLFGVLVALVSRQAPVPAKAAATLVLFITIVYTILQSEPRYSVPFRGFEMTLAMSGAATAWTGLRKRWTSKGLPIS